MFFKSNMKAVVWIFFYKFGCRIIHANIFFESLTGICYGSSCCLRRWDRKCCLKVQMHFVFRWWCSEWSDEKFCSVVLRFSNIFLTKKTCSPLFAIINWSNTNRDSTLLITYMILGRKRYAHIIFQSSNN